MRQYGTIFLKYLNCMFLFCQDTPLMCEYRFILKNLPTYVRLNKAFSSTSFFFRLLLQLLCETRQESSFICSYFQSKFSASGQQIQKSTQRTFYSCTTCCRHGDLDDAHLSFKRLWRKSIIYIYKNTLNGQCRSFISVISMYASHRIFNMVFIYTTTTFS